MTHNLWTKSIWRFEMITFGDHTLIVQLFYLGERTSICELCSQEFSMVASSTTLMWRHLKQVHPILYNNCLLEEGLVNRKRKKPHKYQMKPAKLPSDLPQGTDSNFGWQHLRGISRAEKNKFLIWLTYWSCRKLRKFEWRASSVVE